jgi:hypothetical protein
MANFKNHNYTQSEQIAIFEESGQYLHEPSGKWYTNESELNVILKEEASN